MKILGAHWTRSNLQLIWKQIQPDLTKEEYVWNNQFVTDKIIKAIYSSANNIHWLAVLGGITKDRLPTSYPAKYKAFLAAIANRYPQITHWQVGNETLEFTSISAPESSRFTADEYAEVVKLAISGIHAVRPDAKILLAAPDSTMGAQMETFMSAVLARLIADQVKFSGVDLHFWPVHSGYKMATAKTYRDYLNQNGRSDAEIWSCEFGTWEGTPTAPPVSQSQQQQARFLIKAMVYNFNNGVDKIMWTNLVEWKDFAGQTGSIYNSMGLIGDGVGNNESAPFNTTRVAYWAYQMLAAHIDTPVADSLGIDDSLPSAATGYCYRNKATAKKLCILWSDTATNAAPISVPYATDVAVKVTNMVTDANGNVLAQETKTPSSGSVTLSLGVDPILIEEQ